MTVLVLVVVSLLIVFSFGACCGYVRGREDTDSVASLNAQVNGLRAEIARLKTRHRRARHEWRIERGVLIAKRLGSDEKVRDRP
jgi:hypothetical protein